MNRMMMTAANSLNQLQHKFDIISHNIANVQTPGFKTRNVSFAEMMYQEINNQPSPLQEEGRLSPLGIRQGVGAKLASSAITLSQGALMTTNRPLDLAFTESSQFLKVRLQDENGETNAFTRNGSLYLSPVENNQVMLVTQDGHAVLDENDEPITFSDQLTDYTILPNGTFQASGTNGIEQFSLGVIALHRPQIMEQKGDTLLGLPENLDPAMDMADVYTDLVGAARGEIAIQQSALEGSNVDLSKELTDMINVQRALQFQSRAISISDQMMGLVNGIR